MNKITVKCIGLIFLLMTIMSPIHGCVTTTTQPVSGGPSPQNKVALDSIKELDDRVVITLSGNAELNYTPYRLESPLRLVIDVPDAVFDKPEKDVTVGNDTISKLSKLNMTSDGKNVARLEIYLAQDTNYFVAKPSDYQIRIEVQKLSAAPITETTPETPVSTPTATTLPPATKIINVVADDETDGTIVTILADGSVENFESFVLESPYRLVVDIKGLTNTFPTKEVKVSGSDIKAIRIGTYPDKTRVVMESVAPDKINTYNVFPLDNKLMVSFRKAGEMVLGSIPPPAPPKVTTPAPEKPATELPVTELAPTTGYSRAPEAPASTPVALPGETTRSTESVVVPPGEEVTTPPTQEKVYTGKLMTVNFSNAKVRDLMRVIADFSDMNIIVRPEVEDKLLTLHLKKVPWDQILDMIVASTGLFLEQTGNVIIVTTKDAHDKELETSGKASIALDDVSPLESQLIPITYRKFPNAPREGEEKKSTETTSSKTNSTKKETTKFDMVQRIRDLGMLSLRGKIVWANEEGDLISVRDTQARVDDIVKMIRLLDTPVRLPEVRIEARIVEVNDVYEQDLGIKWVAGYNGSNSGGTIKGALGTLDSSSLNNSSNFDPATAIFPQLPLTALNAYGGAGAMIGLLDNALRLDIQLHALESLGEAQIIESPKVRVLSDEEATLSITTSIPQSNPTESTDETGNVSITSTVEYKDFATILVITPTVNPEGTIRLDINLTHNTQGEPVILKNQSGAENTYYTSFEKNLMTKVVVDNRDTIVIGGLYRKESNSTESGLPALKDIPLLGWLFKTRNTTDNRRELLIFITSTIVRGEDEAKAGE
jgi:type IV pilus secretin PilQ/predicted competence protein